MKQLTSMKSVLSKMIQTCTVMVMILQKASSNKTLKMSDKVSSHLSSVESKVLKITVLTCLKNMVHTHNVIGMARKLTTLSKEIGHSRQTVSLAVVTWFTKQFHKTSALKQVRPTVSHLTTKQVLIVLTPL